MSEKIKNWYKKMKLKPIRILPKITYEKMRDWLFLHRTLHYFAHNIYCRLMLKYEYYSWREWCINHETKNKKV